MLGRVLFYPTLLYNVVMERLSSRQWYTRIDNTAILGALPFRSMTKQLVEEEGVKGVITMNEEYETKYLVNTKQEWAAAGVVQLCRSTADFVAAPTQGSLQKGVDFLLAHRTSAEGGSVYVHCKAGRTRSATVVAAYLMQIHRWTPEEALDHIRNLRPHIVIREAQRQALRTYHRESVDVPQ